MSFEDDIARLNEHFFFSEFTFPNNTFRPSPTEEFELADSVIWLGNHLTVFQLKERNVEGKTTEEKEIRWYERKVLTLGTKQIRDTLSYLDQNDQIQIANNNGHRFHLEKSNIELVHKVICYLPNPLLPHEKRRKKFHYSQTADVIHLIQGADYLGIVQALLTPSELSEYLSFRKELIDKWGVAVNEVFEQALVGQYLLGNSEAKPSNDHIQYLEALHHNAEDWDISGIIKHFPDRITTDNEPTDYYPIVTEIAQLKRNELAEFKKRFLLSMEKCRNNELTKPYRMASPRTQCGFVFIPMFSEVLEHRVQGLKNLTYGCKYDLRLPKCIGVSFAPEDDCWYSVHWCYMEFPWETDEEAERWLRDSNPFREVSERELRRYQYHGEQE